MRYPLPMLVGHGVIGVIGVIFVVTHGDAVAINNWTWWLGTASFIVLGVYVGWRGSLWRADGLMEQSAVAPGADLFVALLATAAVFYFKDHLPEGGPIWLAGVAGASLLAGFIAGAIFRMRRSID